MLMLLCAMFIIVLSVVHNVFGSVFVLFLGCWRVMCVTALQGRQTGSTVVRTVQCNKRVFVKMSMILASTMARPRTVLCFFPSCYCSRHRALIIFSLFWSLLLHAHARSFIVFS